MIPQKTEKWGHANDQAAWAWPISFYKIYWMGFVSLDATEDRYRYFPADHDIMCQPDYEPYFLFQMYFVSGALKSRNNRNINKNNGYVVFNGDLKYHRLVDRKHTKSGGRSYYKVTGAKLRELKPADIELIEACISANVR